MTASSVLPDPPFQYIVKDQTPAEIVWAGRFENANSVVRPPEADWTVHGVARTPID